MSMMYNCREMVDLVSKELDEKLPKSVRVKMAVHLSMCVDCRNIKDQLHHIETLVKEYLTSKNSDDSLVLSEEARIRIEQQLSL